MTGRFFHMSQPIKPFIRPFSHTPSAAGDAESSVRASELTTYAVAAGMNVPAERAAFLAHACAGNPGLREKIEQRFATLSPAPAPSAAPSAAPVAAPSSELQRMPEAAPAIQENQAQPAAMALVPMSAGQLAAITAQRPNTFPWLTATFLAVAVGALGVFLMQEKEARQRADNARQQEGLRADGAVQEAAAARAAAEKERETAAQEISAARKDSEALRAVADEQRQRAETATQQAALARAEAERQRLAVEATATKQEGGAALEAERERDAVRAAQKETNLALADALARLAAAQLDGSRFAEAEASARRSLELRTEQAVTGWPLVESRALLGAALLQRNADGDAGRELAAAASDIEQLGAPTGDVDRARLSMAAKRIVLFYNATGRRKEGTELKRKFDGMIRTQ